jgi:hypothetical protein
LIWFYSGIVEVLGAFAIPIFIAIKRKVLNRKTWAWLSIVTVATTLTLQRWLEQAHKVDSLGLWFTVYCAVIYAIPVLSGAAVLATIWRSSRRASN